MKTVLSNDGTAIAFEVSGNGPPLILVDGALCSRQFGPMPKLAPHLAQHFTVFTYDRRGRGDSGDTAPYAKEREVEDIAALIREAGGSASVYAISSGAALAIEAAACGLNIRKLALYEPPFMVGKTGHRPPADHRAQLTRLASSGRRGDAIKFFMTKVVGMPAILGFIMQWLPMWSKLKAVAHTLSYDAAIMGDYSLPAKRIAAITVPTLVMGGEKSPAALRHAVQAVADALRGAQRLILKGQTHDVKPGALVPAVVAFFASAESANSPRPPTLPLRGAAP
jgi:pimeloyl-ACP methyl ester carboxylesterase